MSQVPLQHLSEEVLNTKYRLQDKQGNYVEDAPNGIFRRVANALAAVEEENIRASWEKKFYEAMLKGAYPGGRIVSNAGAEEYKPSTSLINCTLSGYVRDNMESILQEVKDAGLTLRAGCGIGYCFSTLRPKGAFVGGTGATTSGPLSFMDIFDSMCSTISSAGGRRGAQMATFDIRHPDVVDFIRAKREDGRLRKFNMSVLVTDHFLQVLEEKGLWNTYFPISLKELQSKHSVPDDWLIWDTWSGYNPIDEPDFEYNEKGEVHCKIYSKIKAEELWNIITESTYNYSEPGVIFVDTINYWNNLWFCEDLQASNPCFTGDTKVWTDKGEISFKKLAKTGNSVKVLTQQDDGTLVFRLMHNPRKTQTDASLIRIHFDNETFVDCTLNHVFYMKEGGEKRAKDLNINDRISSVYRKKSPNHAYPVLRNGIEAPHEHHVAIEFNSGRRPNWPEEHGHHINGIQNDNRVDNVEILDASYHNSMHMRGDQNPSRRFPERNKLLQKDHSGKNNGNYRHDITEEEVLRLKKSGLSVLQISKKFKTTKRAINRRLEMAANHVVSKIEHLDEKQDVYCGTVEETSKFFVALGKEDGVLVSNCGEVILPNHGSCLLGSINLVNFVKEPFEKSYFDYEDFYETAKVFTRMLDNVVEINGLPLQQQRDELERKRRHGMGILGLGSALIMMGIRYGTEEAIRFTENVMKNLVQAGWEVSEELAKEKGPAPIFEETFPITPLIEKMWGETSDDLEISGAELFGVSPYIRFLYEEGIITPEQLDFFESQGPRFSHHTAIAPTGTLSLALGNNTSGGCEPTFAHSYFRNLTVSGKKTRQQEEVMSYEYLLYQEIMGKCEVKDLPDYFVGADDITPKEHVNMQAAAQKYVDQSISKTVNFPEKAPIEDFKDLYRYGYEKGLKGLTTFRYNPEVFAGVLVKEDDLKNTTYEFTLEDGTTVEVTGDQQIEYEGEKHNAAMLFDSIKEGQYHSGY